MKSSITLTSWTPLEVANQLDRDVSVYFRPVDQTRPWKRLPMQPADDGAWSATIPGGEIDPRFDFQYYLEARVATGGTFWPHWWEETPYVVVPVVR